MTKQELEKIIADHQHWLMEDCDGWEGMKADLGEADLHGADLSMADLRYVNFLGADLSWADLSGACLRCANFQDADLTGANLADSDLEYANLTNCTLPDGEEYRMGVILGKPIKGYKKTAEGVILTAKIPAGAVVFCINGDKCRTNRAKIISTGRKKVLHSSYTHSVTYREGKEIVIKNFNMAYNVECSTGFHFFRTRKEAEEYGG